MTRLTETGPTPRFLLEGRSVVSTCPCWPCPVTPWPAPLPTEHQWEMEKSPFQGIHKHNKIFTVYIAEIKPTHRCHISWIPSVDQTSSLWKEAVAAGKFRACGRWRPFPLRVLSCTLSLCCLRNADKSIHQKISSVKLNQERSCQRERNRLN